MKVSTCDFRITYMCIETWKKQVEFRGMSRDLKEYLGGNYIIKEIAKYVTKC